MNTDRHGFRRTVANLQILFCIFASCFAAQSRAAGTVHVLFTHTSANSAPQGVRTLTLYSIPAPFTNGAGAIITRDWMTTSTDASGSATISNLYAGPYMEVLQGTTRQTTNWYQFPNTNGLINASDWVTFPTNGPAGILAYSQSQADGLFLKRQELNTNQFSAANGFTNIAAASLQTNNNFWNAGQAASLTVKSTNTIAEIDFQSQSASAALRLTTVGFDIGTSSLFSSGGFVGDGSGLTTLNASQLFSGTVPTARIGSGTANSHTLAHGNSTWSAVDMTSDVTPPVNTGQFNAVNGVKVMTNGIGLYQQMAAATADYNGQIGISGPGVGGPTLWFANGAGTGSNTWQHEVILPAGVGQIGSLNNMTAGESQMLNVYFNGNPTDMTSRSRDGTGLFLHNPNCFVDGCFFFVPTYTTNNTGGLVQVGTTSDGHPVYLRNAFGHQFGFIPAEFSVGRTNQTGHYIFSLSQGDYPVAGSWNTLLSGENPAVYNQHSWIYFSPSTKQAGFPLLVPNVYTNGQAGWIWALVTDLTTGDTTMSGGLYMGGTLNVTNLGGGQNVLGPNYPDSSVPNLTWYGTTNMALGPGTDVEYFLGLGDYVGTGGRRFGVRKHTGAYPRWSVTAGTPYIISQNDAPSGDLVVNMSSQHMVDKVHISTLAVTLTSGAAGVVFNVTIGAGKSCAGHVIATTTANNATDNQTRIDDFVFCAANKAGTVTVNTIAVTKTDVAPTAGTLTTAWTAVANGNSVDIKNTATSSLSSLLTLKTTWRLELDTTDTAAVVTPN